MRFFSFNGYTFPKPLQNFLEIPDYSQGLTLSTEHVGFLEKHIFSFFHPRLIRKPHKRIFRRSVPFNGFHPRLTIQPVQNFLKIPNASWLSSRLILTNQITVVGFFPFQSFFVCALYTFRTFSCPSFGKNIGGILEGGLCPLPSRIGLTLQWCHLKVVNSTSINIDISSVQHNSSYSSSFLNSPSFVPHFTFFVIFIKGFVFFVFIQ